MSNREANDLWRTATSTKDLYKAGLAFSMLKSSLVSQEAFDRFIADQSSVRHLSDEDDWEEKYLFLTENSRSESRRYQNEIKRLININAREKEKLAQQVLDLEGILRNKEMELSTLKAQAGNEIGLVAQRNIEIERLMRELAKALEQVSTADDARQAFARDQVAAMRRDMERRLQAALIGLDCKENTVVTPPNAKSIRASLTVKNPSRAQPKKNGFYGKPSSTANESIILDLLTFEGKTVRTLFREAQRRGFTATENAIRFIAGKLIAAGNARQGLDEAGRISYRRA